MQDIVKFLFGISGVRVCINTYTGDRTSLGEGTASRWGQEREKRLHRAPIDCGLILSL